MDALDEKVVSELKGLLGDDFVTVYEAFVRSSDQGIQELNQAVNSDDIKTIETIAHTLKGSSANVGAKKLSNICEDMLGDARDSVTDKFNTHLEMINSEYGKVKESISDLSR